MTIINERNITKLFHVFDHHQNGVLTHSDYEEIVKAIAKELGLEKSSRSYKVIQAAYMLDWVTLVEHAKKRIEDSISCEEWLAYHRDVLQAEAGFEVAVRSITNSLLLILDADGDGFVSLSEFQKLYTIHKLPMEEANIAFDLLDKNGNGLLSRDEISQAWADFFCSQDPNAAGHWLLGDPNT